jgi:ankyrin repeat protein
MVRELVKHDETDPNHACTTRFSREDRALFAAVRRGHVAAARIVLSHPRLNINLTSFDGTVLGLLADRGYQKLMKDVLRKSNLGVNIRAQGYPDNIIIYRQNSDEPHGMFLGDFEMRLTWDDTPLLRAARKGFFISVRILLEDPRTDVCATSSDQRTALWWAVHWNRESMVRRLLKADNKAVNMRDLDGWTPLHLAVNLSRSKSMLRLLLKQQDPDLTTRQVNVWKLLTC